MDQQLTEIRCEMPSRPAMPSQINAAKFISWLFEIDSRESYIFFIRLNTE